MARSGWYTSDRKSRLPSNWEKLRLAVGRRDGWKCQQLLEDRSLCGAPANQIDHILANDDDSMSNLQCLCERHHSIKSSQEGAAARAARVRAARSRVERPKEKPPVVPATGKPLFPGM